MKAFTVEQLIGILNRKPIGDVIFQSQMERIFEESGADWFVRDGEWEMVNEAKISKDVALVAKEMRGIIKYNQGVMGCSIKRRKKTKQQDACDIIYVSGGVSFDIPYEQRHERTLQLIDKLEAFGKAHGFSIITKDSWRIWFKREVV